MRRKDHGLPLAIQIVFLGKQMGHLVEQRLASHGLNRTQTLILIALRHHQGLRVLDFCSHARVEPANVTRTLQGLERMGLAERRPHPSDGRASLFYPTGKGATLADELAAEMTRLSAEIASGMDRHDRACLEDGLIALFRAIGHHPDAGEDAPRPAGAEQVAQRSPADAEREYFDVERR